MNNAGDNKVSHQWELIWLGPAMFYLSLGFLALLATIMVLWIDVPRVVEIAEVLEDGQFMQLSEEELAFESIAFSWGKFCGISLLLMWPIFVAEQLFYFLRSEPQKSFFRNYPYWFLFCLLPPLRLCAQRREDINQIWLPQFGWCVVDRNLRRKLERIFSFPMIGIALLILPVLGLQHYFGERIADYPTLRILLHFGTGLIWFAFAVEFIVMVSVAPQKLVYCKQHWLDLVIILLPLVSFLRTLRLLRASKLLKVGKLQQLSRVVRIYRLRGVAMRGLRALLLLEVLHRLLRTKPETRIVKLEQQVIDKQRELDELREEISRLKSLAKPNTEAKSKPDLDPEPETRTKL